MTCPECGAPLGKGESCADRFHALLAAEVHNAELRRVHGLTVLVWHVQHPRRTKPWYQAFAADVLRRAFAGGGDWRSALEEVSERPGGYDRVGERWQQAGPQKGWERALNERKAATGTAMPDWVANGPRPGELTVADIDLAAPAGQEAAVLAWARSVAAHRIPGVAPVACDD